MTWASKGSLYDEIMSTQNLNESEERDRFRDLLRRVKQGDKPAAFELVKSYEPMIRAVVRHRLHNPLMRRQFDSLDICQSVMASFFPGVMENHFKVDDPKQLMALLLQMARNKLAHQMRRHRQKCRDVANAISADSSSFGELPGTQLPPDRVAASREELNHLLEQLDDDTRRIALMRGEGYEWQEIAQVMGGTAEARRKQLQRAIAQTIAVNDE